ncbi:MAG TPA: hypothetical protein VNA16_05045, partial [Abditibacteriaceae bacterium]|nr:hypothetical protein [Abditibacteriaceae bacterium]
YRISIPFTKSSAPDATTTPLLAFTVPPYQADGITENYILERFNAATQEYVRLNNNSTLRRGEGYRLKPINSGTSIKRPAEDPANVVPTAVTSFTITLRRDTSQDVPNTDPNNGFNLIGFPFNPSLYSSVQWSNNTEVTVSFVAPDGRTANSVDEAVSKGLLVGPGNLLRYDPFSNTYVPASALEPYQGYFVQTVVDGLKMTLHVASSTP